MKRSSHEVAGGPKLRETRPAVAGRRVPEASGDVFSMTGLPSDPNAKIESDAQLLAEFEDFMGGDEELESVGLLPAPDSSFRERLRRRLWRNIVVSYLRDGKTTH